MAIFSGLRRLYGAQIDPARLAAAQAFLPGADAGAADMAQQFRQLQADLERLRTFPPGERVQLAQAAPLRGGAMVGPIRGEVTGLAAKGQSGPHSPVADIMDDVRSRTLDVSEDAGRRGRDINGFGFVPRASDVRTLARALYSEFSRTDNWEDMHAGGAAIINRIRPASPRPSSRPELGASLIEVLEKQDRHGRQQFPFMPHAGINAPGGSSAWQRSAHPEQLTGDERKAFEIAHQIAEDLLTGRMGDPTGGATSYRHSRLEGPQGPVGSWARLIRSPFKSPNGQHIFYRHPDDPAAPLPSGQKLDFPLQNR